MKIKQVVSLVTGFIMSCGLIAASAAPLIWSDNGHYYEVVEDASNLSWEDARDWASGLSYTDTSGQLFKGHLATITSLQEANFLETFSYTKTTYLLGGYQTPVADETTLAEMKADWHWVTGETWDFTDWRPSEPNNFFRWVGVTGAGRTENYLQYLPLADDRGWNDVYTGTFTDSDGEHFFGSSNFIIEYEAVSDPEPELTPTPIPIPTPTPEPAPILELVLEPSCSVTYPALCISEASCRAGNANWCGNQCQIEACMQPETVKVTSMIAALIADPLEDNLINSNALFDWAESELSQFFPNHQPTKIYEELQDWYIRYYPDTDLYLGTHNTNNAEVYVYGDVFGGLFNVGELLQLMPHVPVNKDVILNIATEMDQGIRINGVLAANKTAVISTLLLSDTDIKIVVNTENGRKTIVPESIAEDKQSISFVAPADIEDGTLTLQWPGYTSSQSYTAFYKSTPYITSLSPDIAKAGDTIEISAVNLPATQIQLVYTGTDSVLTQMVTPSAGKIHFTLPDNAVSGPVYLQFAQLKSNQLNLTVKRTLDVQVKLGAGVNYNADQISFVQGFKEFYLNSSYSTTLAVKKNDLQYLHAMVDLEDNSSSILYSAVVLPDMSDPVTIDAKSTAIAWIFIGMDSYVTGQDQWRDLYNRVVTNEKVMAFANSIDSLQKNNFSAWSAQSDKQMESSYQEALKDVIQNTPRRKTKRADSLTVIETDSGVVIEKRPANTDITIDTQKLEGGNITILNDTKLYLSVEITSKEDEDQGSIVNNYRHVESAVLSKGGTLIGPQGWGLLWISSAKTLKLYGKDSHIEIITAGREGETDKGELSESLLARVFIEGVAFPLLDMTLSMITNKEMSDSSNAVEDAEGGGASSLTNFLEGMKYIYVNTGFLKQLMTEISTENKSWWAIGDTMVIKPIKSGLTKCFSLEPDEVCTRTLQGLARIIGITDEDGFVKGLLAEFVRAAASRIGEKVIEQIPYIGRIKVIAGVVYDIVNTVTDLSTVAASLSDMHTTPKEINIDVEFPLQINKVLPECVAYYEEYDKTQTQTFLIQGDGFVASDNREPVVSIGYGSDKLLAQSLSLSSSGTEISAHFDFYELMLKRSREETLQVTIDSGYWADSPSDIRLVTSADEVVYFDSISPRRASLGSTITLNGCGWVPLDNIEVTFPDKDGNPIKAEILSKNIEQIKVIIPDEAVSGYVYVNARYKSAHRFFHLKFLDLSGASVEKLIDKLNFDLQGSGLIDTAYLYFMDHKNNRYEASISGITNNSLSTSVPDGLAIGPVRIFVELKDGEISNELVMPKVPEIPTASPGNNTTYEGESISVTLSVKGDGDIYYRLNDETSGQEFKYSAPLNLKIEDSEYEKIYLYAYARVVVDGIDYDSEAAEFIYAPSGETSSSVNECPMTYDPSLDDNPNPGTDPSYTYEGYIINIQDKDGDGNFEDRIFCLYYGSGQLSRDQIYIDDIRNTLKTYFESGQLQAESPKVDGLQHGIAVGYYETGQLQYERPYDHGMRHGIRTWYYESGVLESEYPYVNDRMDGRLKNYDSNGKMTSCYIYENGTKVGSCMP